MNLSRTLRVIVGMLVIVAAISIVGVLVWSLRGADANTRSGVIGFIGMISVALFTHYQTKKREISARHFSDKREGYIKFVDLFFDLTQSAKANDRMPQKDLVEKLLPFKKALIIWGGPEILGLWNSFEAKANDKQSPEEMMRMLEDILRAIRSDLGHDDSALPYGSLVALILVAEDKNIVLGNLVTG